MLGQERLAGRSYFDRPVRPVVTRRRLSCTQAKSKFTYRSAVEIHITDMPAECYAQGGLLERAISGKPVGSECPSHRPLLQHPLHHRKALSLWYRRRRSHRRPQRSLGCSIGHRLPRRRYRPALFGTGVTIARRPDNRTVTNCSSVLNAIAL